MADAKLVWEKSTAGSLGASQPNKTHLGVFQSEPRGARVSRELTRRYSTTGQRHGGIWQTEEDGAGEFYTSANHRPYPLTMHKQLEIDRF
jgi:hypothetical protein